MIPAQMNFPCWSNSDYMESILITNESAPIDLSGLSVRMEVRLYPNGPLVFNPSVSLNLDESSIDILFESKDLKKAKRFSKTLSTDILIIHADESPEIYLQGIVTIDDGVTQNG